MSTGGFEAVADEPADGLTLACRDAMNGLAIAFNLYKALEPRSDSAIVPMYTISGFVDANRPVSTYSYRCE